MISGTGSAFSGCGVCTGAGVCLGAAAMEAEVAAVFRMLGASGCADFLVSLLSHATRNISPAARKTILKRFTQHSISTQACPHHTFCWTGQAAERQHRTLVLTEPWLNRDRASLIVT